MYAALYTVLNRWLQLERKWLMHRSMLKRTHCSQAEVCWWEARYEGVGCSLDWSKQCNKVYLVKWKRIICSTDRTGLTQLASSGNTFATYSICSHLSEYRSTATNMCDDDCYLMGSFNQRISQYDWAVSWYAWLHHDLPMKLPIRAVSVFFLLCSLSLPSLSSSQQNSRTKWFKWSGSAGKDTANRTFKTCLIQEKCNRVTLFLTNAHRRQKESPFLFILTDSSWYPGNDSRYMICLHPQKWS